MREHHDRRAGGTALEIARHPGELLPAEAAEPATLELQYV
jgi:hypothetical protein